MTDVGDAMFVDLELARLSVDDLTWLQPVIGGPDPDGSALRRSKLICLAVALCRDPTVVARAREMDHALGSKV
jgi:hypothetical protein